MTNNNSKKKAQTNPRPITEKILGRYIKKVIETVDAKIGETKTALGTKIDETKKFLEAKIEYSRKDAGEQIISIARSTEAALRKEMAEGFAGTQSAIKSVKEDVENLRTEMHEIRDDLRTEIKDVETRISDKIDTIHTRIDGHEAKSANIAHKAA